MVDRLGNRPEQNFALELVSTLNPAPHTRQNADRKGGEGRPHNLAGTRSQTLHSPVHEPTCLTDEMY